MPKIGEKVSNLQKDLFAGRLKEIENFRALLRGSRPESNILNYHGIGGIGKTTLLTMFKNVCEGEKIPSTIVDASEQDGVLYALAKIWNDLTGNLPMEEISSGIRRYIELDRRLQNERDIEPEQLAIISKATIFGEYKFLIVENKPSEINADDAIRSVYRALDHEDAQFYLDPSETLTDALILDINSYASDNPICIMIDTYEQISYSLDKWFANLIPMLEDGCYLIVAGREELSDKWENLQLVTKSHDLPLFEIFETSNLLALNDITNKALIDQIQRVTGGLPLGIKLCIEQLEAGREDSLLIAEELTVVEEIIKSILRDLSPNQRNFLEICAIAHWFNEDMLKEIVGPEQVEEHYPTIKNLRFVRSHIHGFTLHDRVRDFINGDVRHHQPTRYQEVHGTLSEYFKAQLNDTGSSVDRNKILLETIYHEVRRNEIEGLEFTIDVFNESAELFQADMCELIYLAVKTANLSEIKSLWKEYFAGVAAKLRVSSLEAEEILKNVLEKPASHLEPRLRVYAGRWLAGTLWFAGKFDEVIEHAEQTRDLSAKLANDGVVGMKVYEHRALETWGLALDRLGLFDEGIAKMLELVESSVSASDRIGEGWGYLSAGYFSWHSGDWDQGEDYLLRCLEISRELKSDYMEVYPLGHLGLLYAGLGKFEESYYERSRRYLAECKSKALAATSREMDCKSHQNFAQLEHAQFQLQEAEHQVQLAAQLATKMFHPYYEADALRIWGQILISRGNTSEGIAKLAESYSIASGINGNYIVGRTLVQLYRVKVDGHELPKELKRKVEFEEISNYLGGYRFYHQHSLLHFFRAKELFNHNKQASIKSLSRSLLLGLIYNRFWCDLIIGLVKYDFFNNLCEEINEVEEYINEIVTFWNSSMTDDGIPVSEFESKQRANGTIEIGRETLETQIINVPRYFSHSTKKSLIDGYISFPS